MFVVLSDDESNEKAPPAVISLLDDEEAVLFPLPPELRYEPPPHEPDYENVLLDLMRNDQ